MRRFCIYLLALMLFYGCGAIKTKPYRNPVINLEIEGLLIFMQDGVYFLPSEPDSLFPPEFSEYKLKGIIVSPTKKIAGSYMTEIGAVEYGCSFPPNTPIRRITGYSDDNYFIKRNSCYICYATIKLLAYDKLRISYGYGNPIINYFTWNVIVNGFPIKCNVLYADHWYFEILNAENVDSKQLHTYLNDVCRKKSKTLPEWGDNTTTQDSYNRM